MAAQKYVTRNKHLHHPAATPCTAESLRPERVVRLTFEDGTQLDLPRGSWSFPGLESGTS